MSNRSEQYIWSAFESLRVAERELLRPNEDAVTLCACQCTRNSASSFFRSYLFSKTNNDFHDYSLSDLQYQCAKIDPHFNSIDLTCFECRNDDAKACEKNYCLTVEKVSRCFEQANIIRELVMAKLKFLEKDFR